MIFIFFNNPISLLIFLFLTGNIFAQQEKGIIGAKNWLYNWAEFKPNQKQYDEATQILTGTINKDTKLDNLFVSYDYPYQWCIRC